MCYVLFTQQSSPSPHTELEGSSCGYLGLVLGEAASSGGRLVAGGRGLEAGARVGGGRGQGLGTELALRSIRAMAAEGCAGVALETEVTNVGALALYRNLGFVRDATKNEIHAAHKGGVEINALSAKHGLPMDRIKAILMLKDLEDRIKVKKQK